MKSFYIFSAISRLDAIGNFLPLGTICMARKIVGGSFLIEGNSDVDEGFDGVVLANYRRSAVMSI